ncbi:hypothetical protein GTR04_6025 [Trichophyton interdigitale]|nr:hypothetical protein GY631_4051 [Trichophyton interdigitale]KAG5218330.1 hypothetical protein GY632_5654 [Trichophyton interdigitale]KAG8206600.1 hypothetical protein GTR04_6025 [Trichophyton interdigitale]
MLVPIATLPRTVNTTVNKHVQVQRGPVDKSRSSVDEDILSPGSRGGLISVLDTGKEKPFSSIEGVSNALTPASSSKDGELTQLQAPGGQVQAEPQLHPQSPSEGESLIPCRIVSKIPRILVTMRSHCEKDVTSVFLGGFSRQQNTLGRGEDDQAAVMEEWLAVTEAYPWIYCMFTACSGVGRLATSPSNGRYGTFSWIKQRQYLCQL